VRAVGGTAGVLSLEWQFNCHSNKNVPVQQDCDPNKNVPHVALTPTLIPFN
jgi:hypothetical protein